MKREFKVGDSVITPKGRGVVCSLKNRIDGYVGVHLEVHGHLLHTCGGTAPDGYGWYFFEEVLSYDKKTNIKRFYEALAH
jgi:hypothetical protein